jgi:CHAT domain-containing protein
MNKLILVLILINTIQLTAQTDSLQAELMVTHAKRCLQEEKWDSLNSYITGARNYFKSNNQLAPWLKSYASLAYVWGLDFEKPMEGVNVIEKSLAEKWREPGNHKEWEQYALNLLAAGHFLRVKNADYLGAKKYFEKAQAIFLGPLHEHSDRIARYLYHNLGNIYTRLGDFNRAISLFQRSLNYNRQYPEAKVIDHGDLAIALNEVELHQEALSVVRQGLSLPDLSNDVKVSLLLNEGDALFQLGQPDAALKVLDKIPLLIKEMIKEKSRDAEDYQSQYHATLAEIYIDQKRYSEAEKNGLAAIKIAVKFWGTEKRREIGKVYNLLGLIKLKQNLPQKALFFYHRSLLSVVAGFSEQDISQIPIPNLFHSENTILEALEGKAKAFQALQQFEKALDCYELIPVVEAKIRATHSYESSSLLALKESRTRFQEAISIAWQLYERSNGNPQYAERAFRLTELSRGMLLLQSLMQARQFLPENIKNRDYEIKVQMAWLEHEIALEKEKGNQSNREVILRWEQQLFELKLEQQKLLEDFPSYNHPDSIVLQVLALKDVKQLLRPDQALFSYFFTESELYVFCVEPSGSFQWRKWPLPADFRDRVRSSIRYLWDKQEYGKEPFLQTVSELYANLLEPDCTRMGESVSSLIILPDDVLMMMPLETLLTAPPSSNKPNWRDQPWLLKKYNVSYGYSATLLREQKQISRQNAAKTSGPKQVFGGFAPTYTQSGKYQLQNTAGMVKKVQNILGGDVWTKESDQEAIFKKEASNYRILLLAMHGISDAEHPELSQLLFGDPQPDLVNNNILYATELQIMQLQADLVVLSACHSGFGKLETGEGVYSLARAFAAAKVPATVMSLWLLHENTAPALVESFFAYLQQGKTKDEALRLAKQDYLIDDQNFELSHPFYWAGLVAAGDMQSMELSDPVPHWLWYLLVGIMILLFSRYWMKQRAI